MGTAPSCIATGPHASLLTALRCTFAKDRISIVVDVISLWAQVDCTSRLTAGLFVASYLRGESGIHKKIP